MTLQDAILTLNEANESDVLRVVVAGRQRYPVGRVVAVVARAHKVSIADIVGPRRSQALVNARWHIASLLRDRRADMTFMRIGRAINRDHSSVMHACRRWPVVAENLSRQIAEVEMAL